MRYNDLYNAASRQDFITWLFDRKKDAIHELVRMKDFVQNLAHHPEGKTVYDHVVAAVNSYKGSDPIVRLAILFHDIGKVVTASPSDNGPWHNFYGHDEEGEPLFRNIAKRYGFPECATETIAFAVRNHMRFHRIMEMKRSKVKALVTSPHWNVLAKVAWHDEHCRGPIQFSNKNFKDCYMRAMQVKTED